MGEKGKETKNKELCIKSSKTVEPTSSHVLSTLFQWLCISSSVVKLKQQDSVLPLNLLSFKILECFYSSLVKILRAFTISSNM